MRGVCALNMEAMSVFGSSNAGIAPKTSLSQQLSQPHEKDYTTHVNNNENNGDDLNIEANIKAGTRGNIVSGGFPVFNNDLHAKSSKSQSNIESDTTSIITQFQQRVQKGGNNSNNNEVF